MTFTYPFQIKGFRYKERGWFRDDETTINNERLTESYLCAGPQDQSGHHDGIHDYNAACSCCWLGFGHTEELHQARTRRVDADQDIRRSYTGNL